MKTKATWGQKPLSGRVRRKPVIYLYSPVPQQATVTVVLPQDELFVELDPLPNVGDEKDEPSRKDETRKQVSWCVQTQTSGRLQLCRPDSVPSTSASTSISTTTSTLTTAVTYPYLFWESMRPDGKDFKEKEGKGEDMTFEIDVKDPRTVLVQREELPVWLKSSLLSFGLSTTECEDFLTYWIPLMSKKECLLVRFLSLGEIESHVASLVVEPLPQLVNRVFMVYRYPLSDELTQAKGVEDGKGKGEETLGDKSKTGLGVERGLKVVEWGGCDLDERIELSWKGHNAKIFSLNLSGETCKMR